MAYLNVAEIESALQNLAAAYPATTELLVPPNVTHEGRRVHVLRVGTESSSEADGVLILGGVHAREWVPPDALVSLAADLLEAYKLGTGLGYGNKKFSANDIRQVMETLNLFFFACANPDGRHYSQTSDALWRKNRRPHANGGNCVGVDINRNFDFLWDHLSKFAADSGVSASADPCDRNVYRGPSPTSEPETKNVVWLLDTYPQIRWHVDVHSAVPVILHNWGSDENQATEPAQNFLNSAFDGVRGRSNDTAYREYITQSDLDLAKKLSQRMNDAVKAVRGDDYGVEQAFGLYPTSGASDDYAFSRHFANSLKTKVYGFTVECGHSFQPTWSEAEEVIREVSAGLISFCLEAASATSPVTPSVQGKDIALVRQTPGWGSIPVAFAKGDGTWTITNGPAPNFIPDWAPTPGVRVVVGDFNGNGLTDIALVRQTPGWGSIPIAFAKGDGTWT
ncbi:MAG: M14 family metallopeptidase, partial [Acidobacteria bacterium]|nr:M14 family metallopeptidase [Acidobacteriota bacterium]